MARRAHNRLRAAVIGCGCVGQLHARALSTSNDAELVAVCDTNPGAAAFAGQQFGVHATNSLEQLWETSDLDLVTIATPDHQHVDPTMAAITRGLNVFCEKPLALTAMEAESLRDAARDHGVQLAVDYNRRFGFAYAQAKSLLLDSGASIRHLVLDVTDGIPPVAEQPFALLTSLLSHHIDLVRWYAGEVTSVHARLTGGTTECPHTAALSLETITGAVATVTGSWRFSQSHTDERLRIVTNNEVLAAEAVTGPLHVWHDNHHSITTWQSNTFETGHGFFDTIGLHLAAFLKSVISGSKSGFATADDGCATLRIIESAVASCERSASADT